MNGGICLLLHTAVPVQLIRVEHLITSCLNTKNMVYDISHIWHMEGYTIISVSYENCGFVHVTHAINSTRYIWWRSCR